MKKIGFVVNGLSIGGNEKSVSLLSKALSSEYEIYIIVFDGNNVAFDYDGELIDIKEPAKNGVLNKAIVSIRRIAKIKRIIKEKNLDVLFTVTASVNAVSHYRFRGVKKIVSCRDCGDLERKIKFYAHMVKKAEWMIFNSEHMRAYYLERYPADSKKCFTVNNIVNTEAIREHIADDVENSFSDFIKTHDTIVSVGRFCREKGYNHLIRAFCRIRQARPNAGLVIVGDGELHGEIHDMVDNCVYKSDIYLTGVKKNPYKYMKHCKLFVLSSVSEGFPNVLLEGMACGLPAVAVDCKSGPREILSDKFDYYGATNGYKAVDYGILCERFEQSDDFSSYNANGAETTLAEAILFLLDDNAAYEKYAAISSKRCEYYNAEKAADNIHNIIG